MHLVVRTLAPACRLGHRVSAEGRHRCRRRRRRRRCWRSWCGEPIDTIRGAATATDHIGGGEGAPVPFSLAVSGVVRGACSCCGWCGRRAKTEEGRKGSSVCGAGGGGACERGVGAEGGGGRRSGASRLVRLRSLGIIEDCLAYSVELH